MKRAARFSMTMPSDPAKKASTCVMKYRSLSAHVEELQHKDLHKLVRMMKAFCDRLESAKMYRFKL